MEFEEIYKTYYNDVYRFILSLCGNSHLAEDIASDTFVKAVNAIDNFKGECSVKNWLCQIAKNTYYNYLDKHKRLTELDEEIEVAGFEDSIMQKAESLEIHKILHQLPEPYKEVFSLRLFSELSFAEIGEIFGKTETWARVTFHRAKLKIRSEIQ